MMNKVIKSWGDVSISLYNNIMDLQASSSDEDFIYNIIALFNGMTLEDVLDMPYNKTEELAKNLQFLSNAPRKRIAKRKYLINGRTYKVTYNMQDLTTAQYIDFQMAAPNSAEDIATLLSIILVPEGRSYNKGYDIQEVRDDINNHFSIEDALGLSAFFLNLYRLSIRLLLRQMRKLQQRLRKEERKGARYSKEQKEAIQKLIEIMETLRTIEDNL